MHISIEVRPILFLIREFGLSRNVLQHHEKKLRQFDFSAQAPYPVLIPMRVGTVHSTMHPIRMHGQAFFSKQKQTLQTH
jgi:hypothetical protein